MGQGGVSGSMVLLKVGETCSMWRREVEGEDMGNPLLAEWEERV